MTIDLEIQGQGGHSSLPPQDGSQVRGAPAAHAPVLSPRTTQHSLASSMLPGRSPQECQRDVVRSVSPSPCRVMLRACSGGAAPGAGAGGRGRAPAAAAAGVAHAGAAAGIGRRQRQPAAALAALAQCTLVRAPRTCHWRPPCHTLRLTGSLQSCRRGFSWWAPPSGPEESISLLQTMGGEWLRALHCLCISFCKVPPLTGAPNCTSPSRDAAE